MSFFDILHLALRNLRQAKLRAILTMMGVIVGVAVIVTMVSFGLGLQSNMLARFKGLDRFNAFSAFRSRQDDLVAGRCRSRRLRTFRARLWLRNTCRCGWKDSRTAGATLGQKERG